MSFSCFFFTIKQAGWIIVWIILFTVGWIQSLLTPVVNQNYMKCAEQNSSPYHKPESKESKKRTRHIVLNGRKTERVQISSKYFSTIPTKTSQVRIVLSPGRED